MFENLGVAMFTMVQMFTMDGWATSVARPVMIVYPESWVYFTTIVLSSLLLIVSFVVSAVIQTIELIKK